MFEHGDMRESLLEVQLQYGFVSCIPLTYISSGTSFEILNNYVVHAL